MKRTTITWTIFSAAFALVLIVLSFFTLRMIQFENAMAQADSRAALEEVVRLALWRMDSAAALLLSERVPDRPALHNSIETALLNSQNRQPNVPAQPPNAQQQRAEPYQQQLSETEFQMRNSLSQNAKADPSVADGQDWHEIEPTLLKSVADILPGATLESVDPAHPDDTRRLATIPARLVVPASATPPAALAWNTPVRISLMIAWTCAILATVAAARLMGATMALSERRGAFASAVTHELRTPITTCRMYAEMLASDMVIDPTTRREYLQTLVAESERLGHLVENVLTYSRLERQGLAQKAQRVSVGDLIDRTLPALQRRTAQAGLSLELKVVQEVLAAMCRTDAVAFQQILLNLVDNACKYGKPPLVLEIQASATHVRFAVHDHGPGVPPQRQGQLFKPFNKMPTDTLPGIGLGLYLSRRLARDLGGELTCQCNSAGTTFILTIERKSATDGHG
jgi:signal transduction histidine kinase